MFCIRAEYVLVCYIRVYCFVPLPRDIRQTSKTCSNKCHPFIRFHNFYGFMFFLDAKLARWNEYVMVRFPNG